MFKLILVLIVAGVAFAIWALVKRGREFGDLARRGIPATAKVTRKFRTGKGGPGSPGRRIGYAYTGPDGIAYERFATITVGRFIEVEEGSDLPIVLLPDRPGVAAPAWLVESAREALAKRG